MAGKTSKFLVGLFVAIGTVLTVIIIIWVGATKYFEKGNRYVTYFNESVQGLQKDSAVKFRGVEVGRVEKIQVAPDSELIAVVMKINLRDGLPKDTVAQLKMAGITGLVFVDLDIRKATEKDRSPKFEFPTEYPIIPSRPGELASLFTAANAFMDKLNQVDAKGISDKLQSALTEIENFLRGPRMEAILKNIEDSTAKLRDISTRVDKTIAAGKVDEVLVEARDALKGARTMVATVEEEVRGLQLKDTIRKAQDAATEIKTTAQNLRQASETLNAALERIKDRPSDLLFGQPPRKRWNE